MHPAFHELTAILRCAHFGTSLPHTVAFARSGAADVVRAFDRVVAPMVDRTITNAMVRAHARDALLFASVKGSFLISSYSTMIGLPFPAEISALGGSFARLYDDLIDDIDEVDEVDDAGEIDRNDGMRLDDRLAGLFHGRPFNALTDFERLLEALYHAIEERIDRPAEDPIYAALHALHEYQVLSRRQRESDIPDDSLNKITAGKGSFANVALFALVRPGMGAHERELVMWLGETLQLLDDYADLHIDLSSGITTPVTRGEATFMEVVDRMRVLGPRLREFYGAASRQFVTVLYILLVAAFLRRRRPAIRRSRTGAPGRTRSPLGFLLFRGDGVRPRPGAGRRPT